MKPKGSYCSTVSYNHRHFKTALVGRLIRLFCGRNRSDRWKESRRINFWLHILQKAAPSIVIGIQPGPDLCRAGKILNKPVYDLQHGRATGEHPWYSKNHFLQTPSVHLPDGYLLWDKVSGDSVKKSICHNEIDVRVIGNPWFLRFLYPSTDDPLTAHFLDKGNIFNNDKPTILVSLQWRAALSAHYTHTEFNGVMADALEKAILATEGNYNWLIRLHPVQFRGTEKVFVERYLIKTFGHLGEVEWRECSKLPLPVVLRQANLHITDYSSIVVEAGWMGVPSGLLNIHIYEGGYFENLFTYERKTGIAEVIQQNPGEIINWVSKKVSEPVKEATFMNYQDELNSFIREAINISSNHKDE